MSDNASIQNPSGRHLEVAVVTPEGAAFEGRARCVTIPAHDGEISFFPLHAAFVGAIGVGELRVVTPDGETERYYLEGGVAQVRDDVVTVLAERVAPATDIDPVAAQQELQEAREAVPTTDEAFEDRDRREASARAQLRLAERSTEPA